MVARIAALFVVLGFGWSGFCVAAAADSWGPPKKEHWSDDRNHVLKVRDVGYRKWTLTLKKRSTNGWRTLWGIPNPQGAMPPVQAHFSKTGEFVVLQDRWHRLGYGKVLVFIGPAGKVLRSYRLADLSDVRSRVAFEHSVSSIRWSVRSLTRLDDAQREFWIAPENNDPIIFDLATGTRKPWTGGVKSRVIATFEPAALKKLATEERAWQGAEEAGCLRTALAWPRLAELFEKPPKDFSTEPFRLLVMRSMVRIDPEASDRFLEQAMKAIPLDERLVLQAVLDESLWTPAEPGFIGLLESPNSYSRLIALRELVDEGGPGALMGLRRAFQSSDSDLRQQAAYALGALGEPSDGPQLLLAAKADPELAQGILSDLVRVKPPGVEAFVRQIYADPRHLAYQSAFLALASLGDEAVLARALRMAADPKRYPLGGAWPFTRDDQLDQSVILRVVAKQKPPGARAKLQALLKSRKLEFDWQVSVRGALAVLGSPDQVRYLRRVARGSVVPGTPKKQFGYEVVRADAILWLGLANDKGFAADMRHFLNGKSALLSMASVRALREMGLLPAETDFDE